MTREQALRRVKGMVRVPPRGRERHFQIARLLSVNGITAELQTPGHRNSFRRPIDELRCWHSYDQQHGITDPVDVPPAVEVPHPEPDRVEADADGADQARAEPEDGQAAQEPATADVVDGGDSPAVDGDPTRQDASQPPQWVVCDTSLGWVWSGPDVGFAPFDRVDRWERYGDAAAARKACGQIVRRHAARRLVAMTEDEVLDLLGKLSAAAPAAPEAPAPIAGDVAELSVGALLARLREADAKVEQAERLAELARDERQAMRNQLATIKHALEAAGV